MKRTALILAGAIVALTPTAAHALPSPSITGVDLVQQVNTPHAYTATGGPDCTFPNPPCTYQWRWYRVTSPDRLGTTMGAGQTINYTFTDTGYKRVTVKVIAGTKPYGWSQTGAVVTVTP